MFMLVYLAVPVVYIVLVQYRPANPRDSNAPFVPPREPAVGNVNCVAPDPKTPAELKFVELFVNVPIVVYVLLAITKFHWDADGTL